MKTIEQKVPALRFPEFEGEWEEKKLGEITSIYDGTHQTPKYVEQGIPFYSVEHLTSNNFNDTKFISPSVFEQERVKLEQGDILMTRIGDVGTIKYIDWNVNASFYVSLSLIKSITGFPCCYFLSFNMQTDHFQNELWLRTIHVAFPKKINLGEIGKCTISFPSLPEQQKIADFLSATDKRLELLKEKKQGLEDYKRGAMQRIFSQELRFTRADGSAYEDWEEKKLGEIIKEHKKRNTKKEVEEVFSVAKEKGVINQIEHLGRSYAADDTSNYKVVYPNDIIYTKSPTSGFPFGIIKQNHTNRTGVVSTLYGVFKPLNEYLGYFLHCYFLSEIRTYNYLVPLVQKGAKNTMNINNSTFLDGALFNIPSSLEEQTQIANFLSAIDVKIEKLSEQIEATEDYKKGLLQQMFV